MDKKYLEKLKEEIKSSGVPLEIFSSIVLEKLGWDIRQGSRYLSKRFDKEKEIDIIAEKESISFKNIRNVLVLECKKSEKKPWVFFTQEKMIDTARGGMVSTSNIGGLYERLKQNPNKLHYVGKPYHAYYLFPYTNYFGKEKKEESQIYIAINEVTNATSFLMKQYLDSYYKLGKEFNFLFHPIIVIDGNLISAKIDGENINLRPCNHLQFLVNLELEVPTEISHILKKYIFKTKSFIIDVIKKEYLKEFLKESF